MARNHCQRFVFLVFIVVVIGIFARPVSAQSPDPTPSDDEVNRIAKQMYCPVCENIPLDVCPTQACSEWRELIRLRLSEGWTDDQIKAYFAEQYGDRVLAEPPRRGLNWLVYVLPALFIAGGVFVLWRVLGGMRRVPAAVPEDAPPASPLKTDDPYLREMEEELKNRENE